jgi:hypothetical protein
MGGSGTGGNSERNAQWGWPYFQIGAGARDPAGWESAGVRGGLLPVQPLPRVGDPVDPMGALGGHAHGAQQLSRIGEPITARGMAERAAGHRLPGPPQITLPQDPTPTTRQRDHAAVAQSHQKRPRKEDPRDRGTFDTRPISVHPDGTMSVGSMGISQHVTMSEQTLNIRPSMSDQALRGLFGRYCRTAEGHGARKFAFRLGPADGGVDFGDSSSPEAPYTWAEVRADGTVRRMKGNYYSPHTSLRSGRSGAGAETHWNPVLLAQPDFAEQAEALNYARRLEAIAMGSTAGAVYAPTPAVYTGIAHPQMLANTIAQTGEYVAPRGVSLPELSDSVSTMADQAVTARAKPARAETERGSIGIKPDVGSIQEIVRSAAIDGIINTKEAGDILRAFDIEKKAITAETRANWYALDEDYRINLQNALGVKADGKIAQNGDGKTIGKLRKIARGQA